MLLRKQKQNSGGPVLSKSLGYTVRAMRIKLVDIWVKVPISM